MRIRFTATARAEFLAAIEYMRKDKPGAAVQFRRKAEKALRRLHRFPDSGSKLREFPDLPFREVSTRDPTFIAYRRCHAVYLPEKPGVSRVTSVVENNRGEIERLCRRYRVRRLELFGSAAAGDFDPSRSDLDFLVEFEELEPGEYADTYFGLLDGLRELFKINVDLVTISAVKNPYFLERIEQSRTLLYAA